MDGRARDPDRREGTSSGPKDVFSFYTRTWAGYPSLSLCQNRAPRPTIVHDHPRISERSRQTGYQRMQFQSVSAQPSHPLVREASWQSGVGFFDLYIGLFLSLQSGKLTLPETIAPAAIYIQTQFPGLFTVAASVSAQRCSDIPQPSIYGIGAIRAFFSYTASNLSTRMSVYWHHFAGLNTFWYHFTELICYYFLIQ